MTGHGKFLSYPQIFSVIISIRSRGNDDHQQQQNAIDSSGLMHLITGGGSTNVDSNPPDETLVVGELPTTTAAAAETEITSVETDQIHIEQTITPQIEHEHIHDDEDDDGGGGEDEDDLHHDQQQEQEHELDQQSSSMPPAATTLPLVSDQPMETEVQSTPPTDIDQSQAPNPPPPPPPTTTTTTTTTNKTQHDIAEIHRETLNLIPIPQAWSHIRHQSGMFSYPDLPHFNVIRQATFRDGRFVCPFCTVDFASKEGIRYHLYNSCTKSPYPKAFFRCLMCGSELADRSSLRTHLARHGADENGAISTDKIDVSRKPALSSNATGTNTPNSKKKKKKKTSNDVTPPTQMINPMLAMTSGISPRAMDTYSLPQTMLNSHMSLPIIKSDLNDNDSKVDRKRGRPPKTKGEGGLTPVSSYTKHPNLNNPTGLPLNPQLTNPIMLNDQLLKANELQKSNVMRSPRAVDISSELAELARSRMREHIEFATDSLLPEQEQEINARLRTEGIVQCHRCRGKTQFNTLKKLKEHLKTDCPLGPVMAVCKFCGIPFPSVSTVCDHLELCHDDSHDLCPEDPCRLNDRAFRSAFARYKFPVNGRIPFSAPPSTIGQLIPENESAACLSNGASCLRVRMLSCDRFLNPLDSFAASHVIVLNVGRPIRCIEWLPRGVDIIVSQYVALALEQWSCDTNAYPDRRSPPGSTLLLILNCGRLRQSLHVPNLHVTVAADFGQVTCLKWLPERPTINDPYLSYLAIGTSQGIVLIFGVPHGASRNLCTISSGAQLVPPLNRRKDGSIGCAEYGSCSALDWCHENPNKLCAGYENGIVLMWELNSKSLVEQTTNCSLIYPVRRFFVEDTPIQDVKFLRNSEHLIAVSLKNKQSWTYVLFFSFFSSSKTISSSSFFQSVDNSR